MSGNPGAVLVTGGAKGIGVAIVSWFRERGHEVIAVDSDGDAVRGHRDRGEPGVTWLEHDVRDTAAILADLTHLRPAPLVLVNNAAVAHPTDLLSYEQTALAEMFSINVFAGLDLMRALARTWLEQSTPGVVVNLASVNGLRPMPGMIVYNATKAALISVTQSAAVELAPHGIRVNAVAPGSTLTPAWDELPPGTGDHFASINPLRRLAGPEEIAAVVGFLAGPESSYMTGACVVVDGGLTLGLPS